MVQSDVERAAISFRGRIGNFIRQRVRNVDDAEDILQDVFYQLAESYSVTDPIEKLQSWLFTVARNKIIDWYRRRRRVEPSPRDEEEPESRLNLEDFVADPSGSPDAMYMRSLILSELDDALDDLPDNQREVFVMHELEGKSFAEMAEETGEPINTLLSRKRYAVLYLRERLRDLYNDINIH